MNTKMTMNNEQYENLIALMKQALKFYANSNSYQTPTESEMLDKTYLCVRPELHLTRVEIDAGSQARFALKRVQETLDENQKMMNDYNKVISETIDAIENHPFDIRNIKAEIDALNNIGDEGHD